MDLHKFKVLYIAGFNETFLYLELVLTWTCIHLRFYIAGFNETEHHQLFVNKCIVIANGRLYINVMFSGSPCIFKLSSLGSTHV